MRKSRGLGTKKITPTILGTMTTVLFFLLYGLTGYAKPVVSTYDIKTTSQSVSFIDGPYAVILFGLLFVAGIYLIYHYWANGKLTDDMS